MKKEKQITLFVNEELYKKMIASMPENYKRKYWYINLIEQGLKYENINKTK